MVYRNRIEALMEADDRVLAREERGLVFLQAPTYFSEQQIQEIQQYKESLIEQREEISTHDLIKEGRKYFKTKLK